MGFNPCKGFGGFGTGRCLGDFTRIYVSIPVRVLGVLEHACRSAVGWSFLVSIPVRVLGVLEPAASCRAVGSGILVSIPVRVLGVLEREVFALRRTASRVSIPVRVLGVLEPKQIDSWKLLQFCFNPCKGFGGFGTLSRVW